MPTPVPVIPYSNAAFLLGNLGVSGGIARALTLTDVGAALPPVSIPVATTSEAETGTNNTNAITPLRLREALRASGTAPVYACRAWVNFDGTPTTPSVRASGNVSSITRNGTGDFRVNFAAALPDGNYVPIGMTAGVNTTNVSRCVVVKGSDTTVTNKTTTSLDIQTGSPNLGSLFNLFEVNIAVFR